MSQRHKHPTPWRQIITSGPVWALVIGNLGSSWSTQTLLSDLPKYTSQVLKFSIQANGYLSALPYILTWVVSNTSSWITDWLIKSDKVSRTTSRKALNMMAAVLSAIFLIAACYAGCDRTLAVIFFTIGVGMMGFYYPSLAVNSNDLSTNYSGTITAIINTCNSFTGMLTPYFVGIFTRHQTLSEWKIVFWICFVVSCGFSVIFTIWGDAKIQQWDDPEPRDQRQVGYKDRESVISDNTVKAKQSDGRYIHSDVYT